MMNEAPLQVVLSVDALISPLTGIGRYNWELATGLPLVASVQHVRFFRQGRWIKNPSDLLDSSRNPLRRTWLQKKEPKWLKEWRLKLQCRGRLFHGPNYFLPACADIGVATIHDLSVFRFPETHPAERIRQFETHFQATLARAAHLITDTEAIRREVMRTFAWPAERITAVPLGVSDSYRPHIADETVGVLSHYGLGHGGYCLCVSTIEPRKKIDDLLTAYGRLPTDLLKRFPLVLIGSAGWQSEGVHQHIESCCAKGWVKYFGYVSETDLPILYACARLFVYPSSYEGFGLPVMEAMASGVPVVTSTDPALVELSGMAALQIEPDDNDALLQGVVRGLEDDAWQEKASWAGLQRAGQFTWERCIELTVQVYRHVHGLN